jgi:hypothetical protein
MIKFYRKIRQNLLSEGKTRKYMKYALGEIILVVIGILIALSINNWNDNRKDRISEKELYKTLIRSLTSDLNDVRNKSAQIDSAIIGQQIFITESFNDFVTRFNNKEFFHLLEKVGYTSFSFVPNISIYNKISQNKQIDLIQSEELQMKIMELYELHYWEYKDLDAILESQVQLGLVSNFFGSTSHLFIKNSEELTMESFRNYYDELNKDCRKIYFLSVATKNSMLKCENEIVALLELLHKELKK